MLQSHKRPEAKQAKALNVASSNFVYKLRMDVGDTLLQIWNQLKNPHRFLLSPQNFKLI